jgi:hypothetical protein
MQPLKLLCSFYAWAIFTGIAQAQEAGSAPTVDDALQALHEHAAAFDSYKIAKVSGPVVLKDPANAWDIMVALSSETGAGGYDKVATVDVIFRQGALLSIDAIDFPTGNFSQPRVSYLFGPNK